LKTQTQKLVFKKDSVAELNDSQLNDVNGGATPAYVVTVLVTIAVAGFIKGCSDEVNNDECP